MAFFLGAADSVDRYNIIPRVVSLIRFAFLAVPIINSLATSDSHFRRFFFPWGCEAPALPVARW